MSKIRQRLQPISRRAILVVMTIDRRAAVESVAGYFVPCDQGDDTFEEMINGRWSPGYGTTCTYLTSAALHFAGCRDPRLVNWDDPQGRTSYRIGKGIEVLFFGGRAVGCWVDDAPGLEPQRGDIVYQSNGTPKSEHVEIFWGISGSTYEGRRGGPDQRARRAVRADGDAHRLRRARPRRGAAREHPRG